MEKLKSSKRRLLFTTLALIITMALTATSTFAWFNMNTEADVLFDVGVTSDSGIQIAVVPYDYDNYNTGAVKPIILTADAVAALRYKDDLTLADFGDLFNKHALIPSSYGATALQPTDKVSDKLQQIQSDGTLAAFNIEQATTNYQNTQAIKKVPYVKFRLYVRSTQEQVVYLRNGTRYNSMTITGTPGKTFPVADSWLLHDLMQAWETNNNNINAGADVLAAPIAGVKALNDAIDTFGNAVTITNVGGAAGTLKGTYNATTGLWSFVVDKATYNNLGPSIEVDGANYSVENYITARMDDSTKALYAAWTASATTGETFTMYDNLGFRAVATKGTDNKFQIIYNNYSVMAYNANDPIVMTEWALLQHISNNETAFKTSLAVGSYDISADKAALESTDYFEVSDTAMLTSDIRIPGMIKVDGVEVKAKNPENAMRVAFEGEDFGKSAAYTPITGGTQLRNPERLIYDNGGNLEYDLAKGTNLGWIYYAHGKNTVGTTDFYDSFPAITNSYSGVYDYTLLARLKEVAAGETFTYSYIDVTVWLEGYDGECFDSMFGFTGSFSMSLSSIGPEYYFTTP